ncbi:UDP-N-acetylglucosamine--N-acetylmuramyl-(pentapeptide) pyrophosphoryl-undecaprenol N-acetylglucosamine transferase [Aliarcobacter cryaerophilus ATCC 43158]|uniref:UDP-N-acetylglucosamine--N-acetylmuramyl-(pentapeptide) pyrophosphoryl-undecaprenol N-acetylglucosamine transferase n=1 Tax=Aliarcobacter cryaerophilus ATCC 43158 TaxID=1032070 RepID=A0AAD0XAL8_9BACT|nr:UDP-N-acetylglucosamine--N-acetylmuramyl-(pentapeptide) pyrophosphoryl-undecaprenol N-acetylglucosamine transferase [Aliarcobacter cryaerophilus]AYJ80483.1 N-acetylglucosaminyl transferase [Aliarcobacter cryaerophilus ATCC 43158]PRM96273.1 UDP-N-acetylglucosamine--N-acetylmuramyl-(pentapeptide) pyrophosphoryl-undecaprenol N-acetylglucosamine transferase [Aliarcobacter cryaerophilus]QCZ24697.1 UDP-N-acetylglucosamine--N-acetylmuramyl-(pentapeptide) pyrophosphoryl-undecaprenol N-acetylglucosami
MSKVIVITGGGTGGHLKIADVFINEFKKRGFEVIFIGSSYGQDKFWFENDDRLKEKFFLNTSGVVNKSGIAKLFSLLNIFYKAIFCLKILKKHGVKTVISVGGFSAASTSIATILKKDCNLFLHEQNSKIGALNAKTLKYTKKAYSSFHDFSSIKDYPVDIKFFQNARVRKKIKTIAFFGGSQGAVAINNFALKVAPKLNEMGIRIIHQAGKNDFLRVKNEYKKLNIDADVFDFTKDILQKMNEADFCVSRAGASTLFELCANNLPTFFIPFKYAAQNHQYYNAKALCEQNLCFLQNEDELDENYFFDSLKNSDIEKISIGLKEFIKPNAIEKIVDDILKN